MKYNINKSIEINKDIDAVKQYVADFTTWKAWSPWNILEPECELQTSGTPGTSGHKMEWDGSIIGSGSQELIDVTDSAFLYNLLFIKPFKSKATTSFIFEKAGKGTKVTWTMDSSLPFFMFFMVNTMKNWIGMDYERGLKMLKAVLENGKINAQTTNKGIVDLEGFSYVGIKRTVPLADVSKYMPKDFDTIIQDIVVKEGKSAKNWISIHPKMNMNTMMMTYIAAVSDEELADIDFGDAYVRGEIKPGKALEVKHDGPYDFIGNAWSMGMMYMRAKKIKGGGIPFEQYWNSPKEVKPEELKSSVFFPVKG